MKQYILLILLTIQTILCFSQNSAISTKWKDSIETKLYSQNQRIENCEVILDDKAKKIEEKLNLRNEYIDYKKEHVGWWLNVVGLLVAIFGILIPIVSFLYGRKLYLDISIQKKIVDDEIIKLKEKAQDINHIIKDAETCISVLRNYNQQGEEIIVQLDTMVQRMQDPFASEDLKANAKKLAKEVVTSQNITPLQKDLAHAHEAFFYEKFHLAMELYSNIIKVQYSSLSIQQLDNIYFNMGYIANRLGDYYASISYYTSSLLYSHDSRVYENRGLSYLYLGDVENGMKDLNKAVEINPKSQVAQNNLGLVYLRKYDYSNAEIHFKIAKDLEKTNGTIIQNLAEAYLLQHKYSTFNQLINDNIQYFNNDNEKFTEKFLKAIYTILKDENIDINIVIEEFKTLPLNNEKVRYSFKDILEWVKRDSTINIESKNKINHFVNILKGIYKNSRS